jgi:hypothetical protein
MRLESATNALGNGVGEGFHGIVYLYNPGQRGTKFIIGANNAWRSASGLASYAQSTGYYNVAAVSVNAIRILPSSGNIQSGTFSLIGYR